MIFKNLNVNDNQNKQIHYPTSAATMAIEMDTELIALVDSAIEDAREKSLEEVDRFDVLSQDIEDVVDNAEKAFKKTKLDDKQEDVSLSIIFVSTESLEHLKYVQSMRKFLKKEAKKMVQKILADRKEKDNEKKGKKRARTSN